MRLNKSGWNLLDGLNRSGEIKTHTAIGALAQINQHSPCRISTTETLINHTLRLGEAGYLHAKFRRGENGVRHVEGIRISDAGKDVLATMPKNLRQEFNKNLRLDPNDRPTTAPGRAHGPKNRYGKGEPDHTKRRVGDRVVMALAMTDEGYLAGPSVDVTKRLMDEFNGLLDRGLTGYRRITGRATFNHGIRYLDQIDDPRVIVDRPMGSRWAELCLTDEGKEWAQKALAGKINVFPTTTASGTGKVVVKVPAPAPPQPKAAEVDYDRLAVALLRRAHQAIQENQDLRAERDGLLAKVAELEARKHEPEFIPGLDETLAGLEDE
jgi:hypothetical protein